jgi:hypothetical protein
MTALFAFIVAHLDLILLIALAVSEWLAQTKRTKANSILQLVIAGLKKLKPKDDKVG